MDLSRYTITGKKEAAEAAARNNARLVLIRWPYMLLVFSVVAATLWLSNDDLAVLPLYALILVAGLMINGFFAWVVYAFKGKLTTQHLLTIAQLILDIVLAGLVTYVQGGIEARTTVLYVFPIMTAALMFGGDVVTLAAALSGAGYIIAVLLHLYIMDGVKDMTDLVVPIIFYPAVFLLIGRIVYYLQHIGLAEAREKAYDSFLSLLAHQLKHPASAVTTIIDAINHTDTSRIDATTLRYIEMLKTENENQIRLIDNLLEAAPHKRAAFFVQQVDLVALTAKIAERLADNNERQADLSTLPGSAEKILADVDPIRLGLALTNIFDNAFRYTKPGEAVQYGVSEDETTATIRVHNGGKGMDQEEVVRQLERFSTEGIGGTQQGHVGGLGIGLYAAAQIARSHQGRLDISASESDGTTITLTVKKEHTT